MKKVILCGIDSSTTNTAISIYVNGKYQGYKLFHLDGGSKWERLDPMILSVTKFLTELKPDIICQEDSWQGVNPDSDKCLANLLGAIRGWSLINDCFYYKVMPTEWRALISSEKKGKTRKELKAWAINKVHELGLKDIEDDNVAEAILIGMAYVNIYGEKGE